MQCFGCLPSYSLYLRTITDSEESGIGGLPPLHSIEGATSTRLGTLQLEIMLTGIRVRTVDQLACLAPTLQLAFQDETQ